MDRDSTSYYRRLLSPSSTPKCPSSSLLEPIKQAICLAVRDERCGQLACSTRESDNIIQCPYISSETGASNVSGQQVYQCRTTRSIEAFNDTKIYPSVAVHRFSISRGGLHTVLSKQFRSLTSVWGFSFSHESIIYYPWAANQYLLQLFNITTGYNRKMYDVLLPVYLHMYIPALTKNRLTLNQVLKDKENKSFVDSSILYVNSNCHPPSKRGKFMKSLMKLVDVDSWGKCQRNRFENELPASILQIHNVSWNRFHYHGNWRGSKMALAKSYLFTVAIENSISYDYVTEKLWQPLAAGSVPIYLGAPNIDDWLPCSNCIIDLRQYRTPSAVAQLVEELTKNRTRYAEYHAWREKPINEKFVKLLSYLDKSNKHSLECIVCNIAHAKDQISAKSRILDTLGFNRIFQTRTKKTESAESFSD